LDQDGDDRAEDDAVAAAGACLAEPEAEGNAVAELDDRDILPEEEPESTDRGADAALGGVDGNAGGVDRRPEEGIGGDVGDRHCAYPNAEVEADLADRSGFHDSCYLKTPQVGFEPTTDRLEGGCSIH
jgi:hypothetical protein